MDDIYNTKLLEFAGNISRTTRLDAPDATASAQSKLCGSKLTIDLNMTGHIVSDYAHEVKACALGQAAASIVARNIIGATTDELLETRRVMTAMLKENGPAPEGRFADLQYLMPVKDYRARQASTLLVFDALADCLNQIEQKRTSGAAA